MWSLNKVIQCDSLRRGACKNFWLGIKHEGNFWTFGGETRTR